MHVADVSSADSPSRSHNRNPVMASGEASCEIHLRFQVLEITHL
ncbi:hypothetical protein A2U01_0115527, partial [Trifolium medium]|nr:hypothetical protein [Trifolium medium]